jgi:hypothetical protein
MQTFISKLGYKYNMVDDKEFTVRLASKVIVSHELTPILDDLYQKAGRGN